MFIKKLAGWMVILILGAGCSDVGPVGMVSKPLFNKEVNLPEMDFSRYTVEAVSDLSLLPKPGTDVWIVVHLKNTGGSSTLGYVWADLSIAAGYGTTNRTANSGGIVYSRAYYGQPGKELKVGTEYDGQAGYPETNGQVVIADPTASYSFHVLSGRGTDIPMTLQISDPYGNRWQDNFTVAVY